MPETADVVLSCELSRLCQLFGRKLGDMTEEDLEERRRISDDDDEMTMTIVVERHVHYYAMNFVIIKFVIEHSYVL